MKHLFITIILFISATSLMAQKFERSVGVRLGYSNGIFFDIQNNDLSSYRFMLNWREGGRQVTALKFFHQYKVDKLPSFLSLYYGYGIHAGYSKWDQYKQDMEHGYYWEVVSAPVIGLDALIGISYDLERLPLSVTCDVKPFFDFWGKKVFRAMPLDVAVSAIYHF
jgi:hypothetical protein